MMKRPLQLPNKTREKTKKNPPEGIDRTLTSTFAGKSNRSDICFVIFEVAGNSIRTHLP